MKQTYSQICNSVGEMHVTSTTTTTDAGMRLLRADSCLCRPKVQHVGLEGGEFYNWILAACVTIHIMSCI
jgi:hypothetical protein